MYYLFPLFMFFCGFLLFSFNYNHFLVTLLSLEYMVLSLFWLLFVYMIFELFDMYFVMFMLTFWVCEGILGLSLLVSMIRSYGNDFFFCFNVIQC
uniref:NADH-ubiquinone oxidoreductase chain 4L n=1 Tax=Pulchriphyllium giganteum TaxID=591861 RepID=E2RUS7_9NEOP|nr:NADH dehydrogenase subunit 4L [Pulchriphyllium giganteum]WID87116.1 NADH dehydrogenase subunit 4L [Pulchriphyllium giganteum]BAJ24461.1 NADH dehydrogenase subunit 4L [Pulchriphyllium giganteum]